MLSGFWEPPPASYPCTHARIYARTTGTWARLPCRTELRGRTRKTRNFALLTDPTQGPHEAGACPNKQLHNSRSIRGLILRVLKITKTKLRGLSPRANYTDRATAACPDSIRSCYKLSRPQVHDRIFVHPLQFIGYHPVC
jgi:hypothetical protein